VFNEVDYEHAYTVEEYTRSFDAVVRGVRAQARNGDAIQFNGLNLPNIDNASKVSLVPPFCFQCNFFFIVRIIRDAVVRFDSTMTHRVHLL
jgi:hypothetical protein